MKLNITKWLYIGFAFAILFVILIGIASYKTFSLQADEQARVNHSYQTINRIREIESTISQIRSAYRSLIITNDSTSLTIYTDISVKLSAQLSDLERLMSDNSI